MADRALKHQLTNIAKKLAHTSRKSRRERAIDNSMIVGDADWQHVRVMGESLKTEELRTLSVEQILNRLYHDQQVRVMAENQVAYLCSCSKERMAKALIALGEAEHR